MTTALFLLLTSLAAGAGLVCAFLPKPAEDKALEARLERREREREV